MKSYREYADYKEIFSPAMLACALAYAAMRFSSVLANMYLYSAVAESFGPAREIATIVGAATFLTVALVSYFHPNALNARVMAAIAVAGMACSLALVSAGLAASNVCVYAAGLCLRTVAQAFALMLFALCLLMLESNKEVALAMVLGMFVSSVLAIFAGALGTEVNAAFAIFAMICAVVAWAYRHAGETLSLVSKGDSASDLKLADPSAFLPFYHPMFICAFLFSTASGFALTFNEVNGAPVRMVFETPLLALLIAYILVFRGKKREDVMFSISVLFAMAGFLSTPLSFATDASTLSNTLLRFADECFIVVIWVTLVGIGRLNVYGYLYAAGFMRFASAIGTAVGAASGHVTNAFVGSDYLMSMGFALSMAFAFFAFLWCGFRRFSFSDTIAGITPVSHPRSDAVSEDAGQSAFGGECGALGEARSDAGASPVASGRAQRGVCGGAVDAVSAQPSSLREETIAADGGADELMPAPVAASAPAAGAAGPSDAGSVSPEDSLSARCRELSERYGLTKRESEVFELMAHGRNGRYVMDYFTISRNTAKSHIKHIYSKLGVHSHQELIDLAEGNASAGANAESAE